MSGRRRATGGGHVLALVSDAAGVGGGISAYNDSLLSTLAELPAIAGVRVLARRAAGAAGRDGVLAHERARAGRLDYAAGALRAALARRYDWVFCGHLFHAPLARAAAALAGARLWCQAYGIEAWSDPGRGARRALERADLVTAISRVTRDRLLGWADLHPSRVRVLPCTLAPEFTPGPAPAELRARLGLPPGPLLLTVSRLASGERYKGHEQVMRALTRIDPAAGPRPTYAIAGDGDDRARLERRARELGVADRVVFTGPVDAGDLPDLYRSADVFVMPSTGEGFGIVYLEAAACGLAVVGGDRDGARDALRDGVVGQLVDPEDAGAIARAVTRALRGDAPPGDIGPFSRAAFRDQLSAVLAGCEPRRGDERWS